MKWRSKKGFTLSELLIAAAIFALAMSGILLMFINCAFLDQANRNKSIATIHAEFVLEGIMEYMRNNELSSFHSSDGTPRVMWDWSYDTIGDELGCTSPYAYPCVLNSETITTEYGSPGTDPLEITVTVSWKDRERVNERDLILRTLISKR